MNTVLFFLGQFGFAYIVGHSAISAPFRYLFSPEMYVPEGQDAPPEPVPGRLNAARHWLTSLLECPACLGFWTGGFGAVLFGSAVGIVAHAPDNALDRMVLFVFFGCCTAGSNFLLSRLSRLI